MADETGAVVDWLSRLIELGYTLPDAGPLSVPPERWDPVGPVWRAQAEQQGFMAAGHMLRYGKSLQLGIPGADGTSLERLAAHLVRLREHARKGSIRNSWLNPGRLEVREKIVVVSSRSLVNLARAATTVNPDGDFMASMDRIQGSEPLAIVVDLLPGSSGNTRLYPQACLECLPEVPVIVLTGTGHPSEASGSQTSPDIGLWVVRLHDTDAKPGKLEIVTATSSGLELIPPVLEGMERASVHDEGAATAFRFGHVACQVVRELAAGAKPDANPHQPRDWLNLLPCGLGVAASTARGKEELSTALNQALQGIVSPAGKGKSEILLRIGKAAFQRRPLLVMVGLKEEAATVSSWATNAGLDTSAAAWQVLPMDGTDYGPLFAADEKTQVVVAGTLLPPRLHWLTVLAGTGLDVTIIAYPWELPALKEAVDGWWNHAGQPSAPAGDKLAHLRLQWQSERGLTDSETNPQPCPLTFLPGAMSKVPAGAMNWVQLLNRPPDQATLEKVLVPPPMAKSGPQKHPLVAVAEEIMKLYPNRLIMTRRAWSSLSICKYEDPTKFREAMRSLATDLHEVLVKRTRRLEDVTPQLESVSIEYTGKMSKTTIGRAKGYKAKYKNENVNFDKHLVLGRQWDERLTMRIHFDVDEEEKAIVIHHAGKHKDLGRG